MFLVLSLCFRFIAISFSHIINIIKAATPSLFHLLPWLLSFSFILSSLNSKIKDDLGIHALLQYSSLFSYSTYHREVILSCEELQIYLYFIGSQTSDFLSIECSYLTNPKLQIVIYFQYSHLRAFFFIILSI